MSVTLMSTVFYAEFPDLRYQKGNQDRVAKASTCKLMLLAYADHANDEGESAYPGYSLLEVKTALSRQGIADTLEALRQNEFLIYVGISKRETFEYTINRTKLEHLDSRVKPLDHHQSSHLTTTSQATRLESSLNHPLNHPQTAANAASVSDSPTPPPSESLPSDAEASSPAPASPLESTPNQGTPGTPKAHPSDDDLFGDIVADGRGAVHDPYERRSAEETMKSIEETATRALVHQDSHHYAGYNETAVRVLMVIHQIWGLQAPRMAQGGRKGSNGAKTPKMWENEALELQRECGDYGSVALEYARLTYQLAMKKNSGIAPYTIKTPASLVGAVRTSLATAHMQGWGREDMQAEVARLEQLLADDGDGKRRPVGV